MTLVTGTKKSATPIPDVYERLASVDATIIKALEGIEANRLSPFIAQHMAKRAATRTLRLQPARPLAPATCAPLTRAAPSRLARLHHRLTCHDRRAQDKLGFQASLGPSAMHGSRGASARNAQLSARAACGRATGLSPHA